MFLESFVGSLVGHALESSIATHHINGQPTTWQEILLQNSYKQGVLWY